MVVSATVIYKHAEAFLRHTLNSLPFFDQLIIRVHYPTGQERSQGGNGDNCPQLRKIASKKFWVIKRLTCKPKKYFRANQQNCLKQGSATFFALRTGFSQVIFCGPAVNKIMNFWHMLIYYNL